MIFARRALQRRMDELRPILGMEAVSRLAARLNVPGRDRFAAIWEVAVLHALSKLGELENEVELSSGRRPDVRFSNGRLSFVADITTVSDEGLDSQNPVDELLRLVEATKTRLGLPIGGVDVRVGYAETQLSGGKKISLRLPEQKRLAQFVSNQIEPEIRKQIADGACPILIHVRDDDYDLTITIDPNKAPYSTASFISYDLPTVKNSNPLFRALGAKAKQIRAAEGLRGIIITDGDSATLRERHSTGSQLTARDIVQDFLRQNSSVDFVCLLILQERQTGWHALAPRVRTLHAEIIVALGNCPPDGLGELFRSAIEVMPKPVMMPVNAALRAREEDYWLGFHGGYQMTGKHIKISSREVMELLAGTMSPEKREALNRGQPNPFLLRLQQGRLPSAIRIVPGDENDPDDWIEFEFGRLDPAVSPFK